MERVDGYSYYFVRSCELRTARTGNPFAALTLLATDGSVLSGDDMLLLQHIILAHHGKKEWGAPCEPATLSAELVHHLDMLSARADMFLHAENMSSVQGLSGRKVITKDILPDIAW